MGASILYVHNGLSSFGATRQDEVELICKVIMQGLKGRSSFVVSSVCVIRPPALPTHER